MLDADGGISFSPGCRREIMGLRGSQWRIVEVI
jgi:hypothetical protein